MSKFILSSAFLKKQTGVQSADSKSKGERNLNQISKAEPEITGFIEQNPMKLITQRLVRQLSLRRFLVTAGIVLTVTGLAKVFTITGETTLLEVPDPIFGMEFRYLMLLVGVIELVIAGFCFYSKWQTLSILMVAWIASGFLVYRVWIHIVNWERPCGCLGNLTDVLGISPQAVEWVSVGLLGFLLVGSYGTLVGSICVNRFSRSRFHEKYF